MRAWLQANVRNYYMQFEESQTQSLIDSKIMEFAQHARPPSLVSALVDPPAFCLRWQDLSSPIIFCRHTVSSCLLLQPGMPPAMPLGVGMGGPPQGVLF